MKNRAIKIRILSGMLCTGLLLSRSSFSFAKVNKDTSKKEKFVTSTDVKVPVEKSKEMKERHIKMKATFETVIKESIEAKIITKDEGDRVLKYVAEKSDKKCKDDEDTKKVREPKKNMGLFAELVEEGILSKAKADIIKDRLHDKRSQMRNEEIQKELNILVNNKVITIEQSAKVQEAIKATYEVRKENFKRIRELSDKEKEEFIRKMKDTNINPIKALVDNGTITIEQEKEIQKLLPHYYQYYK